MPKTQPTDKPVCPSPGARRTREARERQREGLRCVTIEMRGAEVDALIVGGFLAGERRDDRQAVAAALGALFDRVPLARIVGLASGAGSTAELKKPTIGFQ